jgi:hypothetical protein
LPEDLTKTGNEVSIFCFLIFDGPEKMKLPGIAVRDNYNPISRSNFSMKDNRDGFGGSGSISDADKWI